MKPAKINGHCDSNSAQCGIAVFANAKTAIHQKFLARMDGARGRKGEPFFKKTVTIGANQVTVPTHYYKVIFDLTPPRKMIGFILPNEESDRPLSPNFSINNGMDVKNLFVLNNW